MVHTVKGFGIVNKAEIDVFLELSCFFNDSMDVGNLISGSSTCSKFSKPDFNNIGTVKFQMLKLDLEKAEEPEVKLPTSLNH